MLESPKNYQFGRYLVYIILINFEGYAAGVVDPGSVKKNRPIR
jgi:hypothetical protein